MSIQQTVPVQQPVQYPAQDGAAAVNKKGKGTKIAVIAIIAVVIVAIGVFLGIVFVGYEGKFDYFFEGKTKVTDMPYTYVGDGFWADSISGTYTGWCKNNLPDGSGEYNAEGTISNDTAKILTGDLQTFKMVGEWKNGMLNGQGELRFRYPNSSKETTKEDEYVRKGEFKDSKLNGQGENYSNQFMYKGEFKDDYLEGEGEKTITSTFGNVTTTTVYTGQFKNGKLSGEGEKIATNDVPDSFTGIIKEERRGTFVDDELNGKGEYVIVYESQTTTFTGTFADDKPIGQVEQKVEYTSGKDKGYVLIGRGEFENGSIAKGSVIEVYDPDGTLVDSFPLGY